MWELSWRTGRSIFVWQLRKILNHRKCWSTRMPKKESTTMYNFSVSNIRKNSEILCLLPEHWDQEGDIKDIWSHWDQKITKLILPLCFAASKMDLTFTPVKGLCSKSFSHLNIHLFVYNVNNFTTNKSFCCYPESTSNQFNELLPDLRKYPL